MQLDSIQQELESLLEPGARRSVFVRLWGITQEPVEVQTSALLALMRQLTPPPGSGQSPTRGSALVPYFDAACHELHANVRAVQELAQTRPHPPFAYVTWLWKVSQVLQTLERDRWLEPVRSGDAKTGRPPPPALRLRLPVSPLLPPLPAGEKLRGLAVEPLLEIASRETRRLGRRRRLLEAARRVLLDTAANMPTVSDGVQARVVAITEQIRQINQWQADGLDPDIDVAHQLRSAVKGRDAARVTSLLAALDQLSRGSPEPSALGSRVSDAQRFVHERFERLAAPPTLDELCKSTFGDTAAAAVRRGSARAETEANALPGAAGELIRAGSAVDGSFELGRTVAPIRVLEEQRRMVEVDFPTQTLVLAPARRVNDLSSSLIDDPRLVLYDFASHVLLSRHYLAQKKRPRPSTPRYAEARFYLLDGSASMAGRRGRMRDAIVIAELATMIRHLEHGNAKARPVVYYRYFSKGAEPLVKAGTVADASAAIEALLVRKSRGETDIEAALLESFADLSRIRESDPTMKRAQLVLVTDGVAPIDLERVWQARQALGKLPLKVSVIALGTENDALKELARVQRARGEAVFYHYLSDATLYTMARGVRVRAEGPIVPQGRFPAPPSVRAKPDDAETDAGSREGDAKLWQDLEQLVDELTLLRQPPDLERIEQAQALPAAYEDLGLSLSDAGFEAERAHCEAQKRDLRALCVRFDRWFPDLSRLRKPHGAPPPSELLEVVEVALLSVLDLIAYLDGAPLQRRVDAIEILERLLVEAGVAPWSYCRALPFVGERARLAIAELRALVSGRDGGSVAQPAA